jgi:hypothetical protein
MRRSVLATFAVLFLAATPSLLRAEDGFKPLFNGKSLEGWEGNDKLWSVVDGTIVGTTDDVDAIKKNTFLATKKTYKNFTLKAKFKLRNGNSGIQFRSKSFPENVVKGYQADIAENMFMGILYEEGGRGILVNVKPDEVAKHVKNDDWNEYVITADGPKITQTLNGFTTVDYTEKSEEGAKEGVIALQLHVGPKMRITFKDVELKELP